MIDKRKYIAAFIFITHFLAIAANAQTTTSRKKNNPNKYEWGNLGFGAGLTELRSDVTTRSYGVSYNRKTGLIFIQGAIYGGMNQDIPSLFGIHFAPGYAIGYHKPVMIALSIGPGYYAGDSENRKAYRALGVNSTLQLLFKPGRDIGLGGELFFSYPFAANISNPPASNGIRIVLTISTK